MLRSEGSGFLPTSMISPAMPADSKGDGKLSQIDIIKETRLK